MKHIYISIILLLSILSKGQNLLYVSPTGMGTGKTLQTPGSLKTIGLRAPKGSIVYLLPGVYEAPYGQSLLEYYYNGGELGQEIVYKSYNKNDPAILRSNGEGNWALIKIYPREINGILYTPKYLIFEDIVFQGNSRYITINEKNKYLYDQRGYEDQSGAYCNKVTVEGFLQPSLCPSFSDCTGDTDGDGIFNDQQSCEQVRYNGQGLLVTGPFAWDGTIKDLINRKKPDGTIIPGFNNYAIPHHITVRNCTFKEFPGAGLSFQRADYITVEGCTVINNCWYTIFGSSGINLYQMVPYEGANPTYNATEYRIKILNNICYGNGLRVENQNLVVRYDGNGIIVDDFLHEQDYRSLADINLNRTIKVTQNRTNPNRGYFYYGPYKGKTLVANNILFGNGGSGLKVYSSQYVDIFHNTFFNNGIGEYRNRRTDGGPLGWLKPQFSLFVQTIVDEKADPQYNQYGDPLPRPTILPGYHRIFNNITYNTIGYPGDYHPAEFMDFVVASEPVDQNQVGNNFEGNPSFIGTLPQLLIPNLAVTPTIKEYNSMDCFKVAKTSPTINYGIYRSETPIDFLRYTRDVLPDAGAYEIPTECLEKILVGNSSPTIPLGLSSNIGGNERKVYRAQKSVTFQGVYVSQAGAVVNTEVAICNMTPMAVVGRISYEAETFETENDPLLDNNLAYPNPISNGFLHFNMVASHYQLFNIEGSKVLEGSNAEQLNIDHLKEGLYLLRLDGVIQKIVIK